jgi:hypothetical protein
MPAADRPDPDTALPPTPSRGDLCDSLAHNQAPSSVVFVTRLLSGQLAHHQFLCRRQSSLNGVAPGWAADSPARNPREFVPRRGPEPTGPDRECGKVAICREFPRAGYGNRTRAPGLGQVPEARICSGLVI